jgi:RNA polymerase sigma factor (sigma-70 family)
VTSKLKTLRGVAERDKLAATCYPMVYHLARKLSLRVPVVRRRGYDDAVQDGFLGLLRAAEVFDPKRGVKFSSFACHYISGYIRRIAEDSAGLIHLPRIEKNRRNPRFDGQRLAASKIGSLCSSGARKDCLSSGDPPCASLERQDSDLAAARLMAKLPPRLAAVVRERVLNGKTLVSLAASEGVKPETVKKRWRLALQALREAVA